VRGFDGFRQDVEGSFSCRHVELDAEIEYRRTIEKPPRICWLMALAGSVLAFGCGGESSNAGALPAILICGDAAASSVATL
jgi:hypothetical protein